MPVLWAVVVVALVVIVWFTLKPLALWLSASYTVTNRRLINRSGVFTRRGPRHPAVPDQRREVREGPARPTARLRHAGHLRRQRGGTVRAATTSRDVEELQLVITNLLFSNDDGADDDGTPSALAGAASQVKHIDPTSDPSDEADSVAPAATEPGGASTGRPGKTSSGRSSASAAPDVGRDRRRRRGGGPGRASGCGGRSASPTPADAAAFTAADREAMAQAVGVGRDRRARVRDRGPADPGGRAHDGTARRLAGRRRSARSSSGSRRPARAPGPGCTTGLEVIRAVEPTFEDLLMYAWRRHLAAAVGRVEALGAKDSDLHTVTVTVGFADLVSFTELVERHRRGPAGRHGRGVRVCVLRPDRRPRRPRHQDAGRLRAVHRGGTPSAGVDIASDIVERIGGDEGLPDVHVGLATGPVVMRLGDVFGPPVNMASRLTGVARRNRVICDDATAEVAGRPRLLDPASMTERPIRGFGTVSPIAVRRLAV